MKTLYFSCPNCSAGRTLRVKGEATISMDCGSCFTPEGQAIAMVDCTREDVITQRLGGPGNMLTVGVVAKELARLEHRLEEIELDDRKQLGRPLEEVT